VRKESKVLLREADTGVHPCNGLGFGVTQKVEGFAVRFIGISQFSPESFHDVVVFIANAIQGCLSKPPSLVSQTPGLLSIVEEG